MVERGEVQFRLTRRRRLATNPLILACVFGSRDTGERLSPANGMTARLSGIGWVLARRAQGQPAPDSPA
jgi:hypothetical protein